MVSTDFTFPGWPAFKTSPFDLEVGVIEIKAGDFDWIKRSVTTRGGDPTEQIIQLSVRVWRSEPSVTRSIINPPN